MRFKLKVTFPSQLPSKAVCHVGAASLWATHKNMKFTGVTLSLDILVCLSLRGISVRVIWELFYLTGKLN